MPRKTLSSIPGFSNEIGLYLHHLIDHEAQHKGQILMLKRLLG